MTNSTFDLIVIGGGITGAGIALDATCRGLKVALIDMQDFAAGTSSRSTKLIHGGLRYLKQMEFKLVAEVGKEREIVHQNAFHLTKPEHMLLPIVKGGSLGTFTARIGMWVYEFLAGVKKEERHRILTIQETLSLEPLLRKDNLLGGILFYEYRTDDARLTIEVMKEAVSRGTLAINYMKAISFINNNKKNSGIKIQDQLTNEIITVNANYIVNATGPWVDELDELDKKQVEHKLHITKGVHIVVDHKRLPVNQSAYFDTHDKRMIFVIPREGKTYIGTTDTFYSDNIVNPKVSIEDRDYLLKCINNCFPDARLVAADVESSWAGLRPLVNKPGKGPSEISRKDELFESTSGLITIAGGKLTGYRKMAQRVVDMLAKKYQAAGTKNISECTTEKIQLAGSKMSDKISFDEFAKNKITQACALGLTYSEAELMVHRHGSNSEKLFAIIERLKTQEHILPVLLRAQLIYSIEEEMCLTPADFFVRRTGTLYFDIESVRRWKGLVSVYMQEIIGWNDELAKRFEMELQNALDEVCLRE